MLKHPTLELLGQLGLAGMADAFIELEATAAALRAVSIADCSTRATGSPPMRAWPLSGRPASGRVGWPAPSATRLSVTIARSSTPGCRA